VGGSADLAAAMQALGDLAAGLDRAGPEPLYRQLAQRIGASIRAGRLAPGMRLPSEEKLTAHCGVSRITVRQALDELVQQGLVVRRQGKGTFVTAPAVKHDLRRLHGLLGSLFSQADAASARLLRYELRPPPRAIRVRLSLRPRQRALALERLYLIAGRAVAIAEDWLAPEVGAVPRAKAELLSTEDLMRAVGIRIRSVQVSIRAEAAGARVGRLLKLPPKAPLLALRRDAYGEDGRIKETGRIFFCSDSYELVCTTAEAAASQGLFDIRNVEAQE
jgi:GntR family transcriptional regulator